MPHSPYNRHRNIFELVLLKEGKVNYFSEVLSRQPTEDIKKVI